MKKLYKVGIYCRLSVDDASNSAKAKNYIPADESVSIENQYELLSKFVMLNGWTEVKSYRDDGYSGGNFQRPGFLEMLEDAQHGLINLILVKDLSRLGRDFVEVGRYTDVIFPSLGCRFVSVLDCLDTEGDNTDMLHFRSLMNDYHLKDLSGKIKSVLHAKMRSGQYIAAYAPYGYRKSEEDRHRLVIDEEAAAVVRRMFELRRAGMAYGKIAAVLEAEKPETLHRACDLLQDLDNYQRITEGAYGYGQQRLQETLGLDDEAIYELDGYMDFEQYGQDRMENDGVTETEFGLLRRLDPPFPEQRQGQQMFQ